jgi:GDP-4-dehydro-6-deoxy-D-mannose reductase
MSRVLITGIAGFAGSHLAEEVLKDSTNFVAGIHHPEHTPQHSIQNDHFQLYHIDILRSEALQDLIRELSPEVIYHLAGLAHVQESWVNRRATIETNFLGTFNLLEACRDLTRYPKILLVGSGECYGVVPHQEQPISEARPLVAASPYSVSKIAQEILGIQYAVADKLPVYISRPFNHTGARQKETFVCSAFAMQIAKGELGLSEPEISVGNLTARRDFSDVRDVVAGYIAIVEQGRPGEAYNICSGNAVSIQEVLDILLSHSTKKFRVVSDPTKIRPVDMPLMLGTAEKLQRETGWRTRYTIRDTLLDLLNYWREKLKA